MLWAGDRIVVAGGVAEGSLGDWATTWDTCFLGRKVLAFHLGDRQSGPLVFFVYFPPALRGDGGPRWRGWTQDAFARLPVSRQHAVRALFGRADAHYHRSDTFRMMVSDSPEEWLCFNGERVGTGDYRVQPANVPYTEWYGRTGCISMTIDADRRGHPPIHGQLAGIEDADALLATVAAAGPYVSELGDVHLRNSDAVSGVASTAVDAAPGGGLSGSVGDDGWTALPNGSSVAAIVMGHPATGPMIVLSRNAPGAHEAPGGVYRTEILRLVLEGSVSVGDRSYRAGEWRLTDADVPQGAVTHGPEGSTQFLLFADRRYSLPVDGGTPCGIEALRAALSRQLEPLPAASSGRGASPSAV
jgi:hypothetical protein